MPVSPFQKNFLVDAKLVKPILILCVILLSCRKGQVVVNRGPLIKNPETGKEEFDQETCFKGRVSDRVYPGGKSILLDESTILFS